MKAMNKIQCNEHAMVTAIGMAAKYFSGMAIPGRTKKDMPFAMAIFLNHANVFLINLWLFNN
jgi:hypothetical protein